MKLFKTSSLFLLHLLDITTKECILVSNIRKSINNIVNGYEPQAFVFVIIAHQFFAIYQLENLLYCNERPGWYDIWLLCYTDLQKIQYMKISLEHMLNEYLFRYYNLLLHKKSLETKKKLIGGISSIPISDGIVTNVK